jgi:autotransporter-associated beta strand protein
MKNHSNYFFIKSLVMPLGVLFGGVFQTQAAWSGAGTSGGDPAATNINNPVYWTEGYVGNDFRSIASNVTLRLTADCTFTNGVDFSAASTVLRHIRIEGTNTLTLGGTYIPGYNALYNRNIFLASNTACTVTLDKRLTLNLPSQRVFSGHSTMFIDARITGAGGISFNYTGGVNPYFVLRNDTNTFTGNIDGDGGTLHYTSIANKGKPSALGAGSSFSINNFTTIYIGSRDSYTDRTLSLLNTTAALRNDSAVAALCFTGTVSIGSVVHTDVYLDGISTGASQLTGNIQDFGYDSSSGKSFYTKLDKRHSGTWRLTGKNTFTGWTNSAYHVNLQGGTLIADYARDAAGAGSNRLFAAGRNVAFSDAKLVVRGKAGSGNTTWQSFGTNTVSDSTFNVLAIDGNGGDGTTVVWDSLAMSGGIGLLRIEKTGTAALVVTNAFAAASGSVRPVNGVLMAASGTRADLLVKDPDGRVGFASQNAALEIVRNTNTYDLGAATGTAFDHVTLSNSLTRTAHLAVATLTLDATANDVTLDMAGYTFQTNGNAVGRGVIAYGSHTVAVQGGTHGSQGSTFIHNYTTNKLIWALSNGTCTYVSAGPGLTEFTQAIANTIYITEGTTRLTAARAFTEGVVSLFGNGVLEIGADLNGTTAGDFTRSVGSGTGQIMFGSGGGFSAYGADRTVNLGGAGAALIWNPSGTANFIPDGKPFILSSPYANATLIFENPLILQNRTREIRVNNGSAAVDARLTGKISNGNTANNDQPVAGLVKSGDGVLELTAGQDYRGTVSVVGGGLRLGADNVYAGGTNALVLSGATLDAGTYRNAFDTLELLTNSVVELGNGSAALAFADCSAKPWTGTLAISGRLKATTLRFGTDAYGLSSAQLARLSKTGETLYLDQQGYLCQVPRGTLISLQ